MPFLTVEIGTCSVSLKTAKCRGAGCAGSFLLNFAVLSAGRAGNIDYFKGRSTEAARASVYAQGAYTVLSFPASEFCAGTRVRRVVQAVTGTTLHYFTYSDAK